jgi:hypothetical protein
MKISPTLKTLTMCCPPIVSQSGRKYRRTLNRSSSTSFECGSRCPNGECLCSGGHQATLVTIARKLSARPAPRMTSPGRRKLAATKTKSAM